MTETFFKQEVEKFQYYQTPKWLYKPPYNELSPNAKHMYTLLYNLLDWSLKNNWIDEAGRVYVSYDIEKFCEALGCSNKSVIKFKKELNSAGLLMEKRRGLGKTNLLFLCAPTFKTNEVYEVKEIHSRSEEVSTLEVKEVHGIKTDITKTNLSNNKLSFCKQVIDYLNEKTGKNFQATSKGHQKFIIARMNEGYTLDQFKQVIDVMVAKWKGTKWEEYLRPKTLFGSSFDDYLNKPMPRGRQVVDEKPDERLGF